jgi:hypothetical protein
VARLLLASGADPTIVDKDGKTPMVHAKETRFLGMGINFAGRRECVAALEVNICLPLLP